MITQLQNYISNSYTPQDYPALLEQITEWSRTKPFEGVSILDATPVFKNTLVKHIALLEGGADLTIAYGNEVPYSKEVTDFLASIGMKTVLNGQSTDEFDVVLDCGGVNVNVKAKYGYTELTKTGYARYENCEQPVFMPDESVVKEIETSLGTGEGLWRGLEHLGYTDFEGKKIVVFGCGKVGSGVAIYGLVRGCKVVVIDKPTIKQIDGTELVDYSDREAVDKALDGAYCVVSCTGIKNSLHGLFDAQKLVASDSLIANMGLEDEFGVDVPDSRILNNNGPLNFILDEPTQLKFIDPTMAFHNLGAVLLLEGKLNLGLNIPTNDQNYAILDTVMANGCIQEELRRMLRGC